jgi:hypothetical protein
MVVVYSRGSELGGAPSGSAFLQIATLEKGSHRLLDDWPPIAILGLKAFIVDLLKGVKVRDRLSEFSSTWPPVRNSTIHLLLGSKIDRFLSTIG